MDYVQTYVPTEDEVGPNHWSKSPEYLAEKAAAVHPGQGFVMRSNVTAGDRAATTHAQQMSNFQVPYIKTEAELQAELDAEKDKAEVDIYEQMAIDLLANVEKALKGNNA
jgi:hypothetical protein